MSARTTAGFRRKDAALPGLAGCAAALRRFVRGQHLGLDVDSARKLAPPRPAFQFLLAVAEVEQAASLEARHLAGFCGELLPQVQAFGGHRQFARIAVLLAAPAPVSARLLGADAALFHQRHLHAALGHVVGGKSADDAAADHDDVRMRRQVRARLDWK
jgi:hypothetical protein